jgi:hypothetical protein
MKRSLWAALGVALIALAVPTMALATHGRSPARHGHHHSSWNGPAGSAATVTTYDQGVLTLSVSDGSTLVGSVSDHTHFICLGAQSNAGKATTRLASFRHSGNDGSTGDTGPSGGSGSTGSSGSSGSTGTTGTGGYGGHGRSGSGGTGNGYGNGNGNGNGNGRGFGHGGHGYGHGHNSYTSPPPCDSSRLVPGAALQSAGVLVVSGGTQFSTIVLPAVQ